jgi:hypothetical protein
MDETTETQVRPGYKTTEFWLTLIVAIAGAVTAAGLPAEHPAVRIAGIVVSAGAALGYTFVRGGVKRGAKMLLVAALISMVAGCCKGHINADAIERSVKIVTERHDKMLKGEIDPKSVSAEDKATFLRTTELLRKVVDEAKK